MTGADDLSPPPASSPGERLESWKQIASYLRRGVRTVQRWEKREGLPVHRHMHDERGTVHAFKGELDAWWSSRCARLEAEEAGEAERGRDRRRRRLAGVGVAAALVLLGAVLVTWQQARDPASPFEERDWVLIATFENRTGEEVFEGTLEHALAYELANSRYINVVPRVRVDDTLELMQRPLDTLLTEELAREVALRDGGIRAVLTGRVEQLDSTYMLSVAVVDPADGAVVAAFREEAAGEAQVPAVLRRLSSRVRRELGESLADIRLSEQQLERVTTPSLRALRLFTLADEILQRPVPSGIREEVLRHARAQFGKAEELLRHAIAEDADFASAYAQLALALRYQQRPPEEFQPYLERAVEVSRMVSQRERHLILGIYYQHTGELEKAVENYRAVLRLHPDHYWGNNHLASSYRWLGRLEDALPYVKRRADLRPNDFAQNCRATRFVATLTGRPEETRPYAERARQLSTPELVRRYPSCAAFLESLTAREHLLAGQAAEALEVAERLEESLETRQLDERRAFTLQTAGLYMSLGRLAQAGELFRQEPDGAVRHWNLALVALHRGDERAFRFHVREMSRHPEGAWWLGAPIFYLRGGLEAEAEKWLREHPNPERPAMATLRGELALARGQKQEAMRLLREGFEVVRHWLGTDTHFFTAIESLARVLEAEGDLEGAVKVLEHAGRQRDRALLGDGVAVWMPLRYHQARLYRELGREQEASEIESELLRLLAVADPNHVLRAALERVSPEAAGDNSAGPALPSEL